LAALQAIRELLFGRLIARKFLGIVEDVLRNFYSF